MLNTLEVIKQRLKNMVKGEIVKKMTKKIWKQSK